MGINILTKQWSAAPTVNAHAKPGHYLAPKYAWVGGERFIDLVGNKTATIVDSGNGEWQPNAARGYALMARKHTATTNRVDLALDTEVLPTANDCSIVFAYQKTDGTARNAVAFGVTGVAGNACNAYIPFSDGTTYWDYGGEAGANRVSVAALTFGDDIWVFTVGNRGSEIWQNGINRVTGAANHPTRTNGGVTFSLSRKEPAGVPGDLAYHKFLFVYHRQLTLDEITRITIQPFCWVEPAR